MTTTDPGTDGTEPADPYPWPAVEADACVQIVGDVNLQNRDDPAGAFRHVRETLAEADVRYANLEGCLFRPGEEDIPGKDRWRHSDEEMIDGVLAAGFDVVGCANNVTYGEEAIENTMRVLDRAGISRTGIGEDLESAREPAVIETNGITLGFLQRTARYYGPEQWATPNSTGVAAFDPDEEGAIETIAADVFDLASTVDVTVFSHHLRKSNTTEIEPYQRELARRVIDAGADLVFGHGAHLNQGIEFYRGRPILHCIGQFAFDWPKTAHKRDGLLLRAHVTDGELSRLSFVPVYRDEENDVYLAGPESPEGKRQLEELRELSEDGSFTVEGVEAVLSLDRENASGI